MGSKSGRRIAVVTDSTSDITPNLAREYDLHVVPQILIMGGNQWLDGIDINPPTFYDLLHSSSDFPTTSQPSAAVFHELFTDLSTEYDGICAVLISNELSGTLNSAQTAVSNLPELPIELVDSRGVSLQLGFTTLEAAKVARAGGDLDQVANAARSMIGRTHLFFIVDTLEYLHRGGRIGGAARLFGSALNLKPILEVKDGIVTPLTRVRTRRKALLKVREAIREHVPKGARVHMAVLHIAAPEDAARFSAQLVEQFQPVEMITSEAGPIIGAHAGPGALGVAFWVD